ncbi:WD repeat-containing protein [Microseira wollei NIES-4236]|uniref:WD repeat-containing protein n=1 Tax=Microseira wollei NIES-4236 TaxID=2530354 RepID=A0AAV3XT94_9CYAN|nr:WD repeat-containing protein [Microseira wollei NIES-4236]
MAGKYKPGYEEYRFQTDRKFIPSKLLSIDRLEPREVTQVKSQNPSIRTLQLTGLYIAAGREILRDYGLAEIDNYSALIHRYQGNPLWLKSVARFLSWEDA